MGIIKRSLLHKHILTLFSLVILFSNLQSQTIVDEGNEPEYYQNIIKLYAPQEDAFIALQYLTQPYIEKRDWNRAIKIYNDHRKNFPHMGDRFDAIIKILTAKEEGIKMVNMGGNINSLYPEYGPVLSPDMKKLYFTGRDREDGIGGEDIFISYYIGSRWQISKPLPGKINTESNEYINSISTDGNTLVMFGNYGDQLGRGDNYYVQKTDKGWSDILHYPEPINSKYWDADAFLTTDGNAILFSSERPGGIGEYHQKGDYWHGMYWGNTDIYAVLRDGNGWSKTAINLGDMINTPFTERNPYLHADGRTLYFSSDGHIGLGKSDVYKSVRLYDTSWIYWSEPINLGKEINTASEDWGYKISTDGKRAYFSTIADVGFGEEDIYSIDLPEIAKPKSDVVTVTGKVLDENGKPVEATIRYEDVELLKEVGITKTDPATGEYFIALPIGKQYAYYADVKGYYSTVQYLDLTAAKAYLEMQTDVKLISIDELIKTGQGIRIENIFFNSGKFDLQEESYEALNLLYKFMSVNDEILVEINAYTDNIGSDSYNLHLSENRAKSVVDYLISKNIAAERLISKGHGKENPVADNTTEEGRALNRRVEFRLLKAP